MHCMYGDITKLTGTCSISIMLQDRGPSSVVTECFMKES